MNIIPWHRRNEQPAVRSDIERFMSRFFDHEDFVPHLPEALRRNTFPSVNVAETESAIEITAELPGMDEKDIDVQVMGNLLVISGERRWEEEKTSKEFHRMESEFGSFRREVPLPQGLRLSPEEISAQYKKGVLKICLPKLEPTPATRIPIKSA
jgi:HSP20 family protein